MSRTKHLNVRLWQSNEIKLEYLLEHGSLNKSDLVNTLLSDYFRSNFDNNEQAILALERYRQELIRRG